MDGNAMAPGVIGSEVPGSHLAIESFPLGRGEDESRQGEAVEPAHHKGAQPGDAAHPDAEWAGGDEEGRRIEDDESSNPVWVAGGVPHADGSAPVVHDENDAAEIEGLEEALQVSAGMYL